MGRVLGDGTAYVWASLEPGVGHLDFKPVGLLVMDKYFPRVSNLIKQLPAQGLFGGFFFLLRVEQTEEAGGGVPINV